MIEVSCSYWQLFNSKDIIANKTLKHTNSCFHVNVVSNVHCHDLRFCHLGKDMQYCKVMPASSAPRPI